jgi:MtrB/PioB family decaheme-associated outer membrane protein
MPDPIENTTIAKAWLGDRSMQWRTRSATHGTGRERHKSRPGHIALLRTCMFGVILSDAGWMSSGALAQTPGVTPSVTPSVADLPVPVLTGPQVQPAPPANADALWWFHGAADVGGRAFLNNPQPNGSVYLGQNSLAKYYEYSTIAPGAFGDAHVAAGTKDGVYQIDLGTKNIGYSDQNYYLDMSKAGEQYLSLGWDQTPHIYSTSAQTPYLGVGTNVLTLPAGLPTFNTVNNASIIAPYLYQTEIGIERDTVSAEYRWTPAEAWDIRADWSHLKRTGTQVDGVAGLGGVNGFPGSAGGVQVPKPVSDTTQNFGVNGEYVGTSLWGQKYVFKVGYKGSQYTDDYSSYTVQSPYCTGDTCNTGTSGTLSPFAQMSLPPSNQANAVNATLAADLPWKSRYAGTVSYAMMTQNAAFIPMTNNPTAPAALNVLPASSLNGDIDTLLSNNVVTSQISSELNTKLTYRYYDFKNNTPQIFFPSWTSYDQNVAGEKAVESLSMAYIKQNAGAELIWRPSREWNLGAAYGWERYDWTQADADVTNESSAKVFADWKPASWVTLRSSGYYSDRRYDNYNYDLFVGSIQFPTTTPATNSFYYSNSYRQQLFDNRDTWKANFLVDMDVLPGVTITPTFKYQDDIYAVDPINQMGLADSRSWNAGIDIAFVVNPDLSFGAGYLRESYYQLLYGITSSSNTAVPNTPGIISANTDDQTTVNTFIAVARYVAIANSLYMDLRYTASRGTDHQTLNLSNGAEPTGGQFPDDTTWYQRLDATATYRFDPDLVAKLGWTGDVKAKLRYTWERNSVSNWQNDPLAPYDPASIGGAATAIWLASDNPNYNVHRLLASIAFTW